MDARAPHPLPTTVERPAIAAASDVLDQKRDIPMAAAGTTNRGPTSAPTHVAAEFERALSLVAWGIPGDIAEAERHCSNGDALACLSLAEVESQNGNDVARIQKAHEYQKRAYSLLVLQCHRRGPNACVAIARMHALGFGLLKDTANEQALVRRARELCKRKSATVCAAFEP